MKRPNRNRARVAVDEVELIAGGYEWTCPGCDELNTEVEVLPEVVCRKCGKRCQVSGHDHAYP